MVISIYGGLERFRLRKGVLMIFCRIEMSWVFTKRGRWVIDGGHAPVLTETDLLMIVETLVLDDIVRIAYLLRRILLPFAMLDSVPFFHVIYNLRRSIARGRGRFPFLELPRLI